MQATISYFSTFFSSLMQAGHILLGIIRPWFIGACLLVTSVLLLPATGQLEDSYQLLLQYFPYALGIIVILLGQQFVQGRIAMAAVNLLIGYFLIQSQLQAPLEQNKVGAYFVLLSLYWPLNFFIIYWFPERKLISSLGTFFAGLIAVEVASAFVLVNYVDNYSQLVSQYFSLQPFGHDSEHVMSHWIMPLGSSCFLLIAASILFVHTLFKRNRSHCVLLACMITTTLLCTWFDLNSISSLFSSLIACALLATLLFNSHDLAFLDELTGLPGRRALMNELKHCGKQYCLVMADIDHFKQFNDTHGHDTGDDVLRIVAQELAKIKGGGKAFRYGGEEFTLLFKRRGMDEVRPHLEKIRESIENYPLIIRDKASRPEDKTTKKKLLKSKREASNSKSSHVQVTVSFGIAQSSYSETSEQVMKSADQALYRAKEKGRNCISR